MKRSEVNRIIHQAKLFLDERKFALPQWAFWKPEDWKGAHSYAREIIEHQLGWDITDFGSGNFHRKGLTLFTIRNGLLGKDTKRFCEKIMVVEELQETPMHFHWSKTEDIINRGGGCLVLELYQANESEELSDQSLKVSIDGILQTVLPGGKVVLEPGQSITLEPYMYHCFYGQEGKGHVLVGEVSEVNDDAKDNRFHKHEGRFPAIEEDESPLHLLVGDYPAYV